MKSFGAVVLVAGLLLITAGSVESQAQRGTESATLSSAPGFYRLDEDKWQREADCRGDECKGCVTKDWLETAKTKPVNRRPPAFLLRSLVGSTQGRTPSVLVFRLDSPRNEPLVVRDPDPVLTALDARGETLLLSLKADLPAGAYMVRLAELGAVTYERFESAKDSICFVGLDSKNEYVQPLPLSLGLFVVR